MADGLQLILVEPDASRLGWGVVRFVGFLQDLELSGDKEDSRVLCVLLDRASAGPSTPALNAKFVFDDHIRCMAAKQRLTKASQHPLLPPPPFFRARLVLQGRQKARQHKMELIADLLEIPPTLRPPSLPSCARRPSPSASPVPPSRPPPTPCPPPLPPLTLPWN